MDGSRGLFAVSLDIHSAQDAVLCSLDWKAGTATCLPAYATLCRVLRVVEMPHYCESPPYTVHGLTLGQWNCGVTTPAEGLGSLNANVHEPYATVFSWALLGAVVCQ